MSFNLSEVNNGKTKLILHSTNADLAPSGSNDHKPIEFDYSNKINIGGVSDGYHTFDELYDFRMLYNAALFNEWAANGLYDVHKSYRHHNGEECFGGGWFIVCAMLPEGQISNHYESKYWDLFRIPKTLTAEWEFDGHTSKDVAERLRAFLLDDEYLL